MPFGPLAQWLKAIHGHSPATPLLVRKQLNLPQPKQLNRREASEIRTVGTSVLFFEYHMVGDTFRRRFRERDARTHEVLRRRAGCLDMDGLILRTAEQYSKPTKVVVTAAL
jgi:hypothetical protein